MRALLAAVAAGPVLALVPAPAHAAALVPDCAVALVNAAAGESRSCDTSGLPPMGNNTFGPYRTVWLLAETGSARAVVSCIGVVAGVEVSGPGFEDGGAWTGTPCRLTLTALTDGTTAQAASLGSYAGSFA